MILINKTNFLLRAESGRLSGKENAIGHVRDLFLKDFCVNWSPKTSEAQSHPLKQN